GKLGEGTFGFVWRVRHTEWQIDLAVKELKRASPERQKNFLRESLVWIRELGLHPHIVTAYSVRELEGTPYLFLEYCPGGSLADSIQQGQGTRVSGSRDLATTLALGIQLAWGLAHCHEKHIVHRDFKPLNVLLTETGEAKITDFGTVKFAALEQVVEQGSAASRPDFLKTLGGQLQGTPPYMPPEQWVKGGTVDYRADLYALGVTLFELLTGDHPVRPAQNTLAGWAAAHAQAPPVALRTLRPDVPAALEALVQRCLAKRPEQRPKSAREVAEVLAGLYGDVTKQSYGRQPPSELKALANRCNNLGASYYDMRLLPDAEKAWEEALRVDARHLEATYNLGLIRWRSGRLTDKDLVRTLREVSAAHSGKESLHALLAQVHLERWDAASAIEELEVGQRQRAGSQSSQSLLIQARAALPASWRCLRTFEGHTNSVSAVAISPDGRWVLSGSWDTTLKLWEPTTGQCRRTFEGHTHHVFAVAFSPDGRWALSGSADNTCIVCFLDWELK
ncbi:MAG: protein kinase, partial [Planctomycetes bacterium]|nr:protein kinase [Planctomycetota bacterium]